MFLPIICCEKNSYVTFVKKQSLATRKNALKCKTVIFQYCKKKKY